MTSILASAGAALLAVLVSTAALTLWARKNHPIELDALPSLVIPSYTTHARLLPAPSKHAFSYPLLYLGVDVDSLETGRLDLPGRLLRYGGSPRTKLLGLRSDGYLKAGSDGLRRKLEALLSKHKVKAQDVGRIWLVTMPSYFGYEGINPLSVWYVYRFGNKSGLLAVVLEVHNTFGEKHAYVLTLDSTTKHAEPTKQYDHTWTFPRSFHVSPFNSRNGFYQLDIVDPFPVDQSATHVPEVRVFLRLLTPEGTPKLQAMLASSPSRQPITIAPQNTARIAGTIFFCYPITLLSTLPRILYQAYFLHYDKKLSVYPRPEPKVVRPETSEEQDADTFNEPQSDDARLSVSVGWQPTSWTEKHARRIVEEYVLGLPRSCGVIEIHFSNGQRPVIRSGALGRLPVLRIDTEDPKFFSNLLSAVTIDDWLVLAAERGTKVSHPGMLERYFAVPLEGTPLDYLVDRLIRRTRQRYRRFLWAHSTIPPTPLLVSSTCEVVIPATTLTDRVLVLLAVWLSYTLDALECSIMYKVGARFVDGQAPWQVWERALRRDGLEVEGPRDEHPAKPLASVAKGSDSTGSWIDLGSIRYAS